MMLEAKLVRREVTIGRWPSLGVPTVTDGASTLGWWVPARKEGDMVRGAGPTQLLLARGLQAAHD